MAAIVKKSFDAPDDLKAPEKTTAQVLNFGAVAATRLRLRPGWSWSECIKPHVGGQSCQAGHVGTLVQGSLKVRMDDGTETTIKAGEAYTIPPGHDAWVVGDEDVVGFEFNNADKTYAVWTQK